MYEIGPFAIIGELEDEPDDHIPVRLIPFSHYAAYPWWSRTTQACLLELSQKELRGKRVLDFGCGASAILGLAAAGLGATVFYTERVLELWAIAQRQIMANGYEPRPDDGGRYDYILANLGDAFLVGQVASRGAHGCGTDSEGELIRW